MSISIDFVTFKMIMYLFTINLSVGQTKMINQSSTIIMDIGHSDCIIFILSIS